MTKKTFHIITKIIKRLKIGMETLGLEIWNRLESVGWIQGVQRSLDRRFILRKQKIFAIMAMFKRNKLNKRKFPIHYVRISVTLGQRRKGRDFRDFNCSPCCRDTKVVETPKKKKRKRKEEKKEKKEKKKKEKKEKKKKTLLLS